MVAERLVRRSDKVSYLSTVQRATMARGSSPAGERERRSLRVQIEENDDVIEIETGEVIDHGSGVTNFLEDTDSDRNQPVGFSPGPGKGRGVGRDLVEPACRSTSKSEDEDKLTNEEADDETAPKTPTATRACVVAGKGRGAGHVTITPPHVRQPRTEDVTPTPLRGSLSCADELLLSCVPSTPEDHRQFDDYSCPATRE